jgi:Cu+-exporting ATPase
LNRATSSARVDADASVVPRLNHLDLRRRAMAKDPVCGMTVDEDRAGARSEYQGQTFYFCSQDCKNKFDKSPETYAARSRAGATR